MGGFVKLVLDVVLFEYFDEGVDDDVAEHGVGWGNDHARKARVGTGEQYCLVAESIGFS